MNEPEQERSGLSMALSALLGTGVGAAAGKYGSRFIPAIKKIRDPNILKEGGEGYEVIKAAGQREIDSVLDMLPKTGATAKQEAYTPSQEALDEMRRKLDHTANYMSNIPAGVGGVVGAGTGLALAPQHDVYEDPLR